MADLTLLCYTANVMPETTAQRIRDYLLKVTGNKFPVISVSQKPINFGQNICVGEIGQSRYNLFKQVFLGVREVKTKYVACIDDDTLYSPEHFAYRPPDDIFSYERNYWFAQKGLDHYWRVPIEKRDGMWGNISNTEALLNNLSMRFKVFPTDPWIPGSNIKPPLWWGEPGKKDKEFGITSSDSKVVYVDSEKPCVVFLHPYSMGSRQFVRYVRRYGSPKPEDTTYDLEQFGSVEKLWDTYWQ